MDRTVAHRFLRSVQHALVYHLVVKPATARTDVTRMFGLTLTVPPTVFHPRFYRTTRHFAEFLQTLDLHDRQVLEMGCGSGLLSLIAARRGAKVTAIDINSRAVDCTMFNARANRLESNIRVLQSNLFDRLPEDTTFDYILWNPPFYPIEPTDDASRAWNAGTAFGEIARFAGSAGRHLTRDGKIIIQVSTEIDADAVLAHFIASRFTGALLQSRRLPFETLSIVEFHAECHES